MRNACILVVEDEPINREVLLEILGAEGYEVLTSNSGAEAWQMLCATPDRFDLVLLDRLIPDMDGIDILRRMKSQPALMHTPVIMQTSLVTEKAVLEGLQAGAYYYLPKPFAADSLLVIVAAAIDDHRSHLDLQHEVRQASRTLDCLDSAVFYFRAPDEVRDIATLLAQAAPAPSRVVLGLSELMLNAIEHGNLGLTYGEKSLLNGGQDLADEIARRLADPAHSGKRAKIEFQRSSTELRFVISDCGPGFPWQNYLEISPERAFDTHGRGIALSRKVSFDRMRYFGNGSTVEAIVTLSPPQNEKAATAALS